MTPHDKALDRVLAESAALLAQGEADAESPWRNPTLVTLGLDGAPQARTVVLRRADFAARQVETHTDVRSAKYRELQAQPAAGLHGWDTEGRVQLRLTGSATLHTADGVADAAWASLRSQTRATYAVTPGPGTPLVSPDDPGQTDEAGARAAFCVVRLTFNRLEYLHLRQGGHRRARFTWTGAQRLATWLVP